MSPEGPEDAPVGEWFLEYRRTGDRALRNRLVEHNRHLADYFVKRYSRRGVPTDDLRQLSLMAILHAVERFDPEVGVAFSTFASRTIDGELKRYFRDRTWSVRPPRRAQELHLELRRADEELTHELGRSPTVPEMARALGVSEDHVLEALEAGVAHQATSLDQPSPGDEDGAPRSDRLLASTDSGYVQVDHQLMVRELIAELPERERTIIYLRFFENLTQPEIAERVGVSQSYLSRVLRRTLLDLKARLGE
ncbi:MAG TPA: SigB/SigF/SigG family RNA polymerase sigma factor [Acidimicrobiales bacterium]